VIADFRLNPFSGGPRNRRMTSVVLSQTMLVIAVRFLLPWLM
jgi:hypothetical protein